MNLGRSELQQPNRAICYSPLTSSSFHSLFRMPLAMVALRSVWWSSLLSSSPLWENKFLYNSFNGKLVVACQVAGNSNRPTFLLEQPSSKGAINSLASRWLLGRSAITRVTPASLQSDMRREFQFLILDR